MGPANQPIDGAAEEDATERLVMAKACYDQITSLTLGDCVNRRRGISLFDDQADIARAAPDVAGKAPTHALDRICLPAPFARTFVEHVGCTGFRDRDGDELGGPLFREGYSTVERAVAAAAEVRRKEDSAGGALIWRSYKSSSEDVAAGLKAMGRTSLSRPRTAVQGALTSCRTRTIVNSRS